MSLQVVLLKNNHMILFIGIVLGSFYYGYAFLQIPGGYLALKLGGTRIFGYAIFLASMLTLLTPVATRYSVYGLIAVRAGEGLMLVCHEYYFYCETPIAKTGATFIPHGTNFLAIGRSRLKIIAFRRSINTKLLSPYENLEG